MDVIVRAVSSDRYANLVPGVRSMKDHPGRNPKEEWIPRNGFLEGRNPRKDRISRRNRSLYSEN